MLYESAHVRVEAADGIAILWLEFPGTPVNALTPARLAELDRAFDGVLANPHLEILVVRSGRPAGFCGGHDLRVLSELVAEANRTAFAAAGQRVLNRLAAADVVTVAYLEGPCLGPGLELALACDYRLAVAGPDSWLGFPESAAGIPPCWGGATRLGRRARKLLNGELVTAREAQRLGLIDRACCARRGKIELRTLLDRLQAHPRKRTRPAEGLARERTAFRSPDVGEAVARLRVEPEAGPVPPSPELIGCVGSAPSLAGVAVEAALRGIKVLTAQLSDTQMSQELTTAVRRGRATPLEADQARTRITLGATFDRLADAGLVVADHATPTLERLLRPRSVLAVPANGLHPPVGWSRPGRVVGVDFPADRVAECTSADVAGWLRGLGYASRITELPPIETVRRAA